MASERSLAPREHGAYGQLGVPLAAALASGRPTPAAALLAAAAIAAFLAHEPLLLLLGHRGERARQALAARARPRLLLLAAAAAGLGAAGLWLAPAAARWLALPALATATLLAPLLRAGDEKSLAGEALAAAALAGAALPVAAASGISAAGALAAWLAWVLGFAAAVAAVRLVIARHKQRREPGADPLLLLVLLAVPAAGLGWRADALAALPLLALAALLRVAPPHPRQLRRVGWALVAASLATGVALVALARMA